MGRKSKYKTKKELADAVERYFRSIRRTVPVMEKNIRPDGTCETVPVLNEDGEPVQVTEYIVPPSIVSMCLRLGIDRSTWQNYCDAEMHPEFAGVTARAKAEIEAYLETELLTRRKGVQGIIFNLQNNYGWKEKKEMEIGAETRKSMEKTGMTIREKMQIIERAKAEMQKDGNGDP